jgi:outer membrane protein TolC
MKPLALFFYCFPFMAMGQSLPILDGYIQQAFNSNHVLKQKQFQVDKSILALEEAKRLFYPDVAFGATYSLAAGGRSIAFPVGDLLNGVYSTLNQLTKTQNFPQLDNIKTQFLPNNFYDARVRTRQPIINAEIKYNRQIKSAQISIQEADLQVYRRELVKDIKSAYFRYLQASEAIKIFNNALDLLAESKRVSESLIRNDKAIPSVITRNTSEVAGVQAQLTDAKNQQRNAAAYFNFLVGRAFEEPVEVDLAFDQMLPAPDTTAGKIRREELDQLLKAQEINGVFVKLKDSYRTPKLAAQMDVGSQAFNFKWGGYVLLGLSLDVPLYTANRNKLQVQQAAVDGLALQEQTKQVDEQIRLQIKISQNNLQSDREIWQSYQAQDDGARQFYRDVFRRYREGVTTNIELLDARNQLTTVAIKRSIAYFNVLIRQVELERALGAYALK